MEFLSKIPVMDRDALRELKKGIDYSFKNFSREYGDAIEGFFDCLLYTSPSPRDATLSRMPSSA